MMRSDKRGAVFLTLVALGVIISVATFFIYLKTDITTFLGNQPLKLIKEYYGTEKDLIAVDQAAKYSMHQSIVDLAANGGLYDSSRCGDYHGYDLWTGYGKICYPDMQSLKDNFGSYMDDNLEQYLTSLPGLSKGDYQYSIDANDKSTEIFGIAKEPIHVGTGKITSTMTAEQIETYFKGTAFQDMNLGSCIKQEETRTNVPAILIVAIAILESGGKNNNKCTLPSGQTAYYTFGIKGLKSDTNCPTITRECFTPDEQKKASIVSCNLAPNEKKYQCLPGQDECKINDYFLSEKNVCDSVNDFTHLLTTNNRYTPAMQFTKEPDKMADLIAKGGYSTSPQWAASVKGVMKGIQRKLGIIPVEENPNDEVDSNSLAFPSFRQKIDYSLYEYDLLVKRIQNSNPAFSDCLGKDDPKTCMAGKLSAIKDDNFDLSLGCETGNEKIFSDFVEFYSDCLNANDDSCTCSFAPQGNVELTFTNKDNQGRETVISALGETETIKASGPLVLENNVKAPKPEYKKKTSENIIVFKQGKAVAFTNTEGKRCAVNKNTFKLCAKSKNSKVIGFDETGTKLGFVPVVYKFAIFLEKKNAPPPVENLVAKDKEKAEKQAMLYWDESSDSTVVSYEIFKSNSDFVSSTGNYRSVEGLTPVKEVRVQDLMSSDVYKQLSDSTPFTFRKDVGRALYSVLKNDGNPIEIEFSKEHLYKLTGKMNKFVYVLGDVSDGQRTYFAVVAVDRFGNKDLAKATSLSAIPLDDLSPGKPTNLQFSANKLTGFMPTSNEDGSSIDENTLTADVYASDTTADTCTKDSIDYTQAVIASSTPIAPGLPFAVDLTGKLTKQKGTGELIKYCISAVARDEEGNAKYDDPAVKIVDVIGPYTIS